MVDADLGKNNLPAYEVLCFPAHRALDEVQLRFRFLLPVLSLM